MINNSKNNNKHTTDFVGTIESAFYEKKEKINSDISKKTSDLIEKNYINSITQIDHFLSENIDNIKNLWSESNIMKKIFGSKNISQSTFKEDFSLKIIDYFINSINNNTSGDCPYLKKFIIFAHSSNLGIEDVNTICMAARYSIKDIINNKIKNIDTHKVYGEIDEIMTKNLNGVLSEYTKELKTLATTDTLTGISNRIEFNKRLSHEINISNRPNYTFSLIVIDIDHFKNINDEFGHSKGDIVLRAVASEINKNIRKCDLFSRYGGEEFTLILSNTTIEGAIVIAEKIKSVIEKLDLGKDFIQNGEDKKITISLGVSEYNNSDTVDQIFQKSDGALYESKNNGRNKVSIHKD